MTIEAEKRIFGKVIRRAPVTPGTTYNFIVEDTVAGYVFPVDATLTVLTTNSIRVKVVNTAFNAMSTPDRPINGTNECVLVGTDVNSAYVPSKIPGVRTTLRWTPDPEAK